MPSRVGKKCSTSTRISFWGLQTCNIIANSIVYAPWSRNNSWKRAESLASLAQRLLDLSHSALFEMGVVFFFLASMQQSPDELPNRLGLRLVKYPQGFQYFAFNVNRIHMINSYFYYSKRRKNPISFLPFHLSYKYWIKPKCLTYW